MNLYHYFTLATLFIILITFYIMAFTYKKRLTDMSRMMLSMAIGTNIGLSAGIFFSSLFKGDLFYSTVLSISAGIFSGITCGLIFGILPTIEGFLAGLMGGMMGAMLGEMITERQSVLFLNLFLILSVSTLFLFPILSTTSSEKVSINFKNKYLFKPIIISMFLLTYFLIATKLSNQMNHSKLDINKHDTHMVENEEKLLELNLSVHTTNFSYTPSNITIKKGQLVTLTLNNTDTFEHDIEIRNFPYEIQNTVEHMNHSNSNLDFHIHAPANSEKTLKFTPIKSGIYEFYCSIPGHKEKGMVGRLIIT